MILYYDEKNILMIDNTYKGYHFIYYELGKPKFGICIKLRSKLKLDICIQIFLYIFFFEM